jgi:hypothetical protein
MLAAIGRTLGADVVGLRPYPDPPMQAELVMAAEDGSRPQPWAWPGIPDGGHDGRGQHSI